MHALHNTVWTLLLVVIVATAAVACTVAVLEATACLVGTALRDCYKAV
jgi:hypothetical protein